MLVAAGPRFLNSYALLRRRAADQVVAAGPQTGFSVIFADGRTLVPAIPVIDETLSAADPPVPEAFEAAMIRASGFKPEAAPEESDLFMAIVAAYGFGAEDYLKLYPEGAYAAEARAILAGPRLTLDALRYTEGSDLKISFQNLPPGSSASVEVAEVAADYATVAGIYIPQALPSETLIPTNGTLEPGVYLVTAVVTPGDGSGEIILNRDFSVARAETVLTLDKTEYAPGATITITFAGMSGDEQDYAATAELASSNTSYLHYVYTAGSLAGTTTLTAPTAPGAYELRAFFKEDESILRASIAFTVK